VRTHRQAVAYVELCRRCHARAYHRLVTQRGYGCLIADSLAEAVIVRMLRRHPERYGER
jgi:hypothetical protein